MDGRDELHFVSLTEQQAEGVGLVVVAVPDCYVPLAAQLEQFWHDRQVSQAAVRDADQLGIECRRAGLQFLETRIVCRVQIDAQRVVAQRLQEPGRIQNGFVRPATGSRHDSSVQYQRPGN